MKINAKKITFNIFIVFIAASIGYYIYANPQIINNLKDARPQKSTDYSKKIDVLQTQINQIARHIAKTPDFNTKAEKSELIALKNQISALNQEIEILSKKTNKNAMILTAALMIKDEAKKGTEFQTQALLLDNLAQSENTKAEVATINSYAKQGVLSDAQLTNDFNKTYKELLQAQQDAFNASQKTSIKTKLDEFIKITKISKSSPDFVPNQDLEELKILVEHKNFDQASQKLNKISPNNFQINEKLNDWNDNIKRRQTLFKAIDAIIAKTIIAIDLHAFNKEQ